MDLSQYFGLVKVFFFLSTVTVMESGIKIVRKKIVLLPMSLS